MLAAAEAASPQAHEALETLCRSYWYPLYVYVRRRGHSPEDAQDFTQEFFNRLLSKNQLASVDRDKGRFRSWLLGVMNHFLAHEWEKSRARKRGGGQSTFSLDAMDAEERYRVEPVDHATPEKLFNRRWALMVLSHATDRLRAEYQAAGKSTAYDTLKGFLFNGENPTSYLEAAQQLELTEGAVKTAIHRLRRRYQELVRDVVAQTVTSPGETDDEIRHLLAAVRG